MPVCYAPPVGTGPRNNGGEFLEPQILTTPQRSNPWSPFTYGGIEVEGARKSTIPRIMYTTPAWWGYISAGLHIWWCYTAWWGYISAGLHLWWGYTAWWGYISVTD